VLGAEAKRAQPGYQSISTPVPTPRAPTATDYAQIQAATNYTASAMSFIGIEGNYCYFGWNSGVVGGFYLLTNTSGTWQVIVYDHGSLNAPGLQAAAPQMTSQTAQDLQNISLVAPPWLQ
jgi:hypothetical protein